MNMTTDTYSRSTLCRLAGALLLGLALPSAKAQQPAGDEELVEIYFPNASVVNDILPIYEDLTGKKLIMDNSIAQATISITAQRKMPKSEAIDFIKATFLINNFNIIDKDEKTDIVVAGQNRPPSTVAPIGVFNDPLDLPQEEVVVAYVMSVNYITPDEAMRAFQTVARSNVFGSITPIPNSTTIVITDTTTLIRTFIELKDYIDVAGDGVTVENIQLVRSSADEVATALTEILAAPTTGGNASATRTVIAAPGGAISSASVGVGGAPDAGGGDPVSAPDSRNIKIQAIVRTNSILIIARPVDIAYIRGLVEHLDAPSQVDNFLKRELKYLSVNEFLPVAENALSRYGGDGAGGVASSNQNRTTGTTNSLANRNRSGSNQSGAFGGNNSAFGNNSGLGGGGSSSLSGIGGSGGLSSNQELAGPQSILVGNTLIIGDSQLNNIIVSGPPEHLRVIDQLLDEVDIRPRQVYISAVIAQVALGDDVRSGIDLLRQVDEINIGGQTVNIAGLYRTNNGGEIASPAIVDPLDLQLVEDFTLTSGLNIWAKIGSYLNAYVQALENTSRFQVLSRPMVYTANNQVANIASGQRVAVPTQTVSSVTNNDTVNSSIGFEEVLLQIEVLPLINSKDEVTLQIAQQNENITDYTTISNNRVPNIATQQLNTTVRLPNKGIVVLGGIIQETERDNIDGLPFLSRIPILRNLQGTTNRSRDRQELLIFIQPTIIEGGDDLVDANVQGVAGTIVGKPALEMARPKLRSGDELFPADPGADTPIVYGDEVAPSSINVIEGASEKRKGFLGRIFGGGASGSAGTSGSRPGQRR